MNFQSLKKIEKADFYIETAIRKAKERKGIIRKSSKGTRLQKSRRIELENIGTFHKTLKIKLSQILNEFPSIDSLPQFYQELVRCTLEYDTLKKSLGGLKWALQKIDHFHGFYSKKIKFARELDTISRFRKECFGRISSIVKQIKDELLYLENARKTMKNYPTIKTSMETIAIAGFPNVGKTTLLSKITGSMPEINSYAFTTKGINIGYLNGIQFIDTPGTLNRFDKMNNIEKVTELAIQLLAKRIIYIFDLTEPYPIEDQIKLFEKTKKFKKNIIVFCSKKDIIPKKSIESFAKKYNAIIDINKLKLLLDKNKK